MSLEEVCAPTIRPGYVLIRTAYSLISAGTERMKVQQAQMSLVAKARSRPDQVAQVMEAFTRDGLAVTYQKLMNRLKTPVPLGYSLSGEVIQAGEGVSDFSVGDRVACAGASANHAEFNLVPKNLCARVPDGVALDLAACTTVGSIALQGIRQATPQLGDLAVVIGLGLVGQFCVQLLIASGCKVLGLDLEPSRLEIAKHLGAGSVGMADKPTATRLVTELSRGIGADIVLIAAASDTPEPVHLAADLARDRARIVDVGKTRLDLPWEKFYQKELDLRMSRSYGPGRYDPSYEERGLDYPVGYVRWTEKRNMELFLDLVAQGQVRPAAIINHRFAISDAEKAYKTLMEDKSALGILLEYQPSDRKLETRLEISRMPRAASKHVIIGIIGGGNFCKSMLLPQLQRESRVLLRGICAGTGLSATNTAKRFGFGYATTDAEEILNDAQINTVIIATRHNLHAPLALAGLRSGKAVLVEKPLAVREEDLSELEHIARAGNSSLMVDYNRRFSASIRQLARWMHSQPGPWISTYRVNAGALPLDHWYYDPEQGGGRLVGEVCHFVDLLIFLYGSYPRAVQAAKAAGHSSRPAEDNAVYTLEFTSGSVGQIIYTAEGDPRVPKERLEVIGNGAIATVENFRRLDIVQNGKKKTWRSLLPDKGHRRGLQSFLAAVRNGTEMPIPLNDLFTVSHVCFQLTRALQ